MEPTERITRAELRSKGKVMKKDRNKKKVKFDEQEEFSKKLDICPFLSTRSTRSNIPPSKEELSKNMSICPFLSTVSMPSTVLTPLTPLLNPWTLWYSAGDKNLSWKENQVKISTVATIEDFWLMYNQVQPPSCLPMGHTFSMFRAGIIPDWEHAANRDGGRWMVDSTKTEREEVLDKRWLEVLFMLMGEKMDQDVASLVVGAEVCVRKKRDRLEVWVGDVSSMCGMVQVGRAIKSKLEVEPSSKIQFSIHKEEMAGIVGPRLTI